VSHLKRRVSRQATLWSRLRTSRVPLGRTAFVQRDPDHRKGGSSSILRTRTRGFSSWRSPRPVRRLRAGFGVRIGFRCGRRPRGALRGGDLRETNPIWATTTRTASGLRQRSYGTFGLPEATGEQSQSIDCGLRILDCGLKRERRGVLYEQTQFPPVCRSGDRRSQGANCAKRSQFRKRSQVSSLRCQVKGTAAGPTSRVRTGTGAHAAGGTVVARSEYRLQAGQTVRTAIEVLCSGRAEPAAPEDPQTRLKAVLQTAFRQNR
jgi:hypothetical protein